jgi:Uma2 family endonuclease
MSLAVETPAATKPITASELLTMPDGDRYELVNGSLKEQAMGVKSSWVAGEIAYRLRTFLEQHPVGMVFPEGTGYQCFEEPDRVRKPDVSLILLGRRTEDVLDAGFCPIAPDLVVEVISPHDVHQDVMLKLEDYFAAGVPLIWLVEPETRTVTVYRQGGANIVRLHAQNQLNGDPVLPGFACQVAEFFPKASLPSASPSSSSTASPE